MNLNLEKIKEITTGTVRIAEKDGFFQFYRFTEEEENLYKEVSEDFYTKTFSTSGVKFLFRTDSETLELEGVVQRGSSRQYYSIDVFVNGEPLDYIDNFSDVELPQNYTLVQLPVGDFSKKFQLGKGEKTVCVHLPWSSGAKLTRIAIDDGALIEGIKSEKKLLAYGDSITHGYDALRPSNKYISKLADILGAEEFNKGIGGEVFREELAKFGQPFVPDYITVAYGTNDWSGREAEAFKTSCKEFFSNLSRNYPEAKIFAITPIWRKDMNLEKKFGEFEKVEEYIRECVKDLPNVTVIPGFDFVPKEEKYFADLRLHPNDEGFEYYAKNLYEQIKKLI